MYEIRFPNLGIHLKNVIDGFYIGNFEIHFYGIIIALGFILGYVLISKEAKRTNQDPELYLDFMLWMVIPAILGARIYYVLFSLGDYIKEGQSLKDTLFAMIKQSNTTALQILIGTGNTMLAHLVTRMV